jgi:hypothetical protein
MCNMKQLTQEQLVEYFPRVFKKIKHVECGEGWYSLLHDLCTVIESHINHYVPEEVRDGIYAVQIKEKFGGLRFYMDQSVPYIDGAIHLAESMSYKICEQCGGPGERRSGGWVRTLCDEHHKEHHKK